MYTVKTFTKEDVSDIYSICTGNPIYYKYMHIRPTKKSILEIIDKMPEGSSLENKYFIGFYKDNIIAILDLITEYPKKDTAHIGWFMVNNSFQGLNVGTTIINDIAFVLKKEGLKYLRLGYIKDN